MGGYNSLPISNRSGNPVLDNIDDWKANPATPLHPLSVQALQKAGAPPQMTTPAPTQQITNPQPSPALPMAPPQAAPMASSMPTPNIQTPHPQVQPVPETAAAAPAQAEMTRLAGSKAGVDQIHNPWGRVPLQILAGIGETFAPRLTTALPGTWSHHNMLLGQAENAVEQQQGIRKSQEEAQTAAATQEHLGAQAANLEEHTNELDPAQAREADARAWSLLNPQDKEKELTEFALWHKQNPNAPVSEWIKLKAQEKTPTEAETPLTDAEIAQYNKQLSARYGVLNKGTIPAEFQLGPGSRQKNYSAVHQALQQLEQGVQANQSHQDAMTMARMNFNATQENRRNEDFLRSYDKLHADLKAELTPVNSQIENLQEARRLIASGAVGQALGTVKSLVAIAGGKGSGLRVTSAELNSIPAARGLPGGFDMLINNIMGSGRLTGESQRQLDQVLGQVEQIASRKQALVNGAMNQAVAAKTPMDLHKIEQDYRGQISANLQSQGGGAKVYSQADVDRAVNAGHGNAKEIEDAFKAKGWKKQ